MRFIFLGSMSSTGTYTIVFFSFVLGSYKYCCHGMFCPGCRLSLTLLVLNKFSLLNHSLSMTCQEMFFQVDTEVDVHPGEYDIKVNKSRKLYFFLCF